MRDCGNVTPARAGRRMTMAKMTCEWRRKMKWAPLRVCDFTGINWHKSPHLGVIHCVGKLPLGVCAAAMPPCCSERPSVRVSAQHTHSCWIVNNNKNTPARVGDTRTPALMCAESFPPDWKIKKNMQNRDTEKERRVRRTKRENAAICDVTSLTDQIIKRFHVPIP